MQSTEVFGDENDEEIRDQQKDILASKQKNILKPLNKNIIHSQQHFTKIILNAFQCILQSQT